MVYAATPSQKPLMNKWKSGRSGKSGTSESGEVLKSASTCGSFGRTSRLPPLPHLYFFHFFHFSTSSTYGPTLSQHLFLRQHGPRSFGASKDAIDQLLVGFDAAALEPEQD